MNKLSKFLTLVFLIFTSSYVSSHELMAAIQSEDRSAKNIARDQYRNPSETLTFFKIKCDIHTINHICNGICNMFDNIMYDPSHNM